MFSVRTFVDEIEATVKDFHAGSPARVVKKPVKPDAFFASLYESRKDREKREKREAKEAKQEAKANKGKGGKNGESATVALSPLLSCVRRAVRLIPAHDSACITCARACALQRTEQLRKGAGNTQRRNGSQKHPCTMRGQ